MTGLAWAGTRTDSGTELALFYERVLGLHPVHVEPEFWVFELPDGRHVEVFGAGYPGKAHFDTGPVIGFAVDDLAGAVEELRRAGRRRVTELAIRSVPRVHDRHGRLR